MKKPSPPNKTTIPLIMSLADEIRKLDDLRRAGILTDSEYLLAKERVLRVVDPVAPPPAETANRRVVPPPLPDLNDPLPGVRIPTLRASEQEARQWALFLHLSQFAGYLVPLAGWIVPIILWQTKKYELSGIDSHGRVVANWLLSHLIYLIISFVLAFVLIGIPLLLALSVCSIIFIILGAIKANSGEIWSYPLSIEFFPLSDALQVVAPDFREQAAHN